MSRLRLILYVALFLSFSAMVKADTSYRREVMYNRDVIHNFSTSVTNSYSSHSFNVHQPVTYSRGTVRYTRNNFTPTLGKEFSSSARSTGFGMARRRTNGFIDDPDPTTPADPLTDNPFIDDPDPDMPADPLNNTPLADCPWLLFLLFVFVWKYVHRKKRDKLKTV